MGLLRTLDLFYPGKIRIPKNEKNRKVFKLDQVSPFNGIEHFAHDALGDVKATIEIAKIVAKKSPEIWSACLTFSEKSKVSEFLNDNQIVFFSETYFGKTTGFGGSYLTNHPIYKYPIMFDLNFDPEEFLGLTVIDGDKDDLRFLDPKNSIVGLYAKGDARKDNSGLNSISNPKK